MPKYIVNFNHVRNLSAVSVASWRVMCPFLCGTFLHFLVHFHPVREAHGHKPPLPVAPVEHCGEAVVESFAVPYCLVNPVLETHLLRPLALDMDTG